MRWAMLVLSLLLVVGCGKTGRGARAGGKGEPPNAEAVRALVSGARQLEAGRIGPAKKLLRKAIERSPDMFEAHHNLGLAHRRMGELELAHKSLTTAHDLAPNAEAPIRALAEVSYALGQYEQASDLLGKLVKERPEDLDARVALASVLREQEAFDQALKQARAVLVRDPSRVDALLEVGRVYRARGQLDVAQLVFEKARALDDKDAAVHNELGLLALTRGDTQRAFVQFRAATAADSQFAAAHINEASVLLNAGDFSGAEREYRAALKADRASERARIGLGIALRGQNKHRAAAKQYQQVLDEHPGHTAALLNLAVLKADFTNDRKGAVPLLERFLELAPEGIPQRELAERYLEEIRMELAPAGAVP